MPRLPASLTCLPSPLDDRVQPFGFPIDRAYIWGAVGYLWGLMVALTALAALVLRFAQAPSPQPTGEPCCAVGVVG